MRRLDYRLVARPFLDGRPLVDIANDLDALMFDVEDALRRAFAALTRLRRGRR